MIKEDFDFTGWQERIVMIKYIHEGYTIREGKELIELLNTTVQKWFKKNISDYEDKLFICTKKLPKESDRIMKNEYLMSTTSNLLYDINKLKINNDKAIIKFVNKYGLPNRVFYNVRNSKGMDNKQYLDLSKLSDVFTNTFYPLEEFKNEVKKIKKILKIHKNLLELTYIDMERNTLKISELRKQYENEIRENNIEFKLVNASCKEYINSENLSNKDLLLIFLNYLKKVVRDRIKNNISPEFLNLGYTPEEECIFNVSPGWFCKDLFTAIYLQLFFILTKKIEVRYCSFCGTPFPVKRNNQEHCNDSCRVKANNYRKRMSIKLYKEGYSINEIYDKLDKRSTKKKIKEWINKFKQKK